jgi:hypothetical protein
LYSESSSLEVAFLEMTLGVVIESPILNQGTLRLMGLI